MMIALATSIAAMACHGCASSGHTDGTSYSSPVAPSLGLTLAVPGRFGQGALNTPTANMFETVGIEAQLQATELFESPGETVTVATAPSARRGFSLTGSGFDSTPLTEMNFAWGSSPALAAVAADLATSRYGQPMEVSRDIALGVSIDAPADRTGLGFDVSVMPRYAIRNEGDITARRFGGEVRFGQSLELGGKTPEGWYFFVGADGEALVWDNSSSMPSLGDLMDVQRTDQVTVGDLQAGFSIQRGPGQLSFSYIRREVKFDDRNRSLKDNEDFAGITFTMRR